MPIIVNDVYARYYTFYTVGQMVVTTFCTVDVKIIIYVSVTQNMVERVRFVFL